jgi:hypothetical protein
MKHHTANTHFSEDELLRTMVDLSDLDPARQAHFNACLHCQRQAKDLADSYNRLGQMARQMAPQPRMSFRMPADQVPAGRWYVKPALALGVLGTLIFVFTLWVPRFTQNSQTPAPMVAQDFENDDQLLAEVDALVEDALPEQYQQLTALSDDRSVEDLDEFMNWMVPPPDEMDDMEQPATSDQEGRQAPIARSDSTIHAEEGTMA